jgi:hypothetical protein
MYSLWTYRPQHKLLEHWSGATEFLSARCRDNLQNSHSCTHRRTCCWHYESRGVFPVKSAYKVFALATETERQAGTTQVDTTRGSAWEKNVWNLVDWDLIRSQWTELQPAPPNVRHELWNWWSSFQRQRLTQTHGFSPHCPCGAVARCGLTK